MTLLSRRSALLGIFAAPAIVRAASLMPVRALLFEPEALPYMSMDLADFMRRILSPAMNQLQQQIAEEILRGPERISYDFL